MIKILCLLFMLFCSASYADDTAHKFTVVTTPDTTTFSFNMTAKGEFTVDWGDGNVDTITRTDTTEATYSHTYENAGEYTIGFNGLATEYADMNIPGYWTHPTISFQNNKNLAAIYGSLGALFPTINGSQPEYNATFAGCTNLSSEIPPDLFRGNYGQMKNGMFQNTFAKTKLHGQIPANLFSDITGDATHVGFSGTFSQCTHLTGPIPEDLFAGITGLSRDWNFNGIFLGCTGLTGEIPEKLFSRIIVNDLKHQNVFNQAFRGCKNLSGFIPPKLFSGLTPGFVTWTNDIFAASGIAQQCPSGYYQYITGFEDYLGGYVSCVPCPDDYPNSVIGATDVRMCYWGDLRKLHIGDNTVGLLTYQTTEPALHIKVNDIVYYGAMTPIETNVMRNSEQKVKIRYNDIIYNLYDVTTIALPETD